MTVLITRPVSSRNGQLLLTIIKSALASDQAS